MLKGEEFLFQRHMEIWKEQNKMIKRIITLTLLFGLLILFRVLIPFIDNTEKYTGIIDRNASEKDSLETQIKVLKEVEGALLSVRKTIEKQPWMEEKDRLIRKFQEINRSGRTENSQQVAAVTVSNIAELVRDDIISPLKTIVESEPAAAQRLGLSEEINGLTEFINDWEKDLTNRRWFSTIVEKDREMRDLTYALNRRTSSLAESLNRKLSAINKEINTQSILIKDLEAGIDEANASLQKVMEELFPKWLQGILTIEHMIQLYPLILLALFLYVAWITLSLSRHYRYVASGMQLSKNEQADMSASSIWTITVKDRRGTVITIASYTLFIVLTWVFFEAGSHLLSTWLAATSHEKLLMNNYCFQALPWAGRVVFLAMLAGILLNHKIKLFHRPPSG